MNLDKVAHLIDQATLKAKPIQQKDFPDLSLQDAYAVQRKTINLRLERGEHITGFKLGFTSRAKMEQMGVHDLIWGFLTSGMQINPFSEVDLNKYIKPNAEPEIAFRVSQPITESIPLKDVPRYIDKMAVAIELIDTRYKKFTFSLEDLVADNCSSAAYCIGEWQDLQEDICDLPIALMANNKVLEQGRSSAILNNPLQPIIELSRLASKVGVEIAPGHIILAGAATKHIPLLKNNEITTQIDKIGAVSFKTK
jgi:2-oxo-3-hexenedioate decarboxylase